MMRGGSQLVSEHDASRPFYDLLSDPPEHRKLHYTLSDLAYEGLFRHLVLHARTPQLQAVSSVMGVDLILTTPQLEGLSWSLFLLTRLPLPLWQDTRPDHIKRQHHIEQEGLPGYVDPIPSRRAKWYYNVPPTEELTTSDDIETKGTLRRKRCLVMNGFTRRYYADLAKQFHMEPRSIRHSIGTLVATSLEAIGIGWLSPPDGYTELLDIPNPNKARPNWRDRLIYKRMDYSILTPVRHTEPTEFTQSDLDFYIQADLPELAQKAREYLDSHANKTATSQHEDPENSGTTGPTGC